MSKWVIHDVGDMPEVLPTENGKLQPGHIDGPNCKCLPCVDEEAILPVRVHHKLAEGKPTVCREPDAHVCGLIGAQPEEVLQ